MKPLLSESDFLIGLMAVFLMDLIRHLKHISMNRILYKYFPLNNEEQFQRVIACLQGKIYFSSPANYNDPFEMQVTISPPNMENIHDFFEEAGNPIHNKPLNFKTKLSQSINSEFIRSPPTIASDEWLQDIGILCITPNPKNILMWSHYASNHKGICIGFSTTEKPFTMANPIIYTDDRPTIPFDSYKNMNLDIANKVFLHKSLEWKYENEWRCVKRKIKEDEKIYYSETLKNHPDKIDEIAELFTENGGPGNYDFDPSCIKRIYFGVKTSHKNKEAISSLLKTSGIEAKKYQLSLDSRHFQLIDNRIKQ